LYLDSWSEEVGDGSLQFVRQRQLEDVGLINELMLNTSSTQQLQ